MKHIVILGGGISGLSTAHYLIKRGYKVTIIETLKKAGGLARSDNTTIDNNIPSEYSWRGFGPWYHNIFDIMKDIQSDNNNSVYDSQLQQINFILTPDKKNNFNGVNNFNNYYRLSFLDKTKVGYLFLKAMMSNDKRSREKYTNINAKHQLQKYISPTGSFTIAQVFGPWVGIDSSRLSGHHAASFFRKNIFPGPPSPYYHKKSIPLFNQNKLNSWVVLQKPSNDAWFDPWVKYLKSLGVNFLFEHTVDKFNWNHDTRTVISCTIYPNNKKSSSFDISADYFTLALNPYSTYDILKKTPDLLNSDKQLKMFQYLAKDTPHCQVSFQIAFNEKIILPKNNNNISSAILLVDSEYDITFYPVDEIFDKNINLGENVISLWSGTATLDSSIGKLYNLPFTKLTKQQFINEIKYQIYKSEGLDALIFKNNNGRHLNSYTIVDINVWNGWKFPNSPDKQLESIKETDRKFINNTHNEKYIPSTQTSITNLYLAGAHTQTNADFYGMEAAGESGRRVADYISNMNTVLPQHTPAGLIPFQYIDGILYNLGGPNVLDVILIIIIILIFIYLLKKLK